MMMTRKMTTMERKTTRMMTIAKTTIMTRMGLDRDLHDDDENKEDKEDKNLGLISRNNLGNIQK